MYLSYYIMLFDIVQVFFVKSNKEKPLHFVKNSHKNETVIQLNWWAIGDSNPGPTGYEPVALTN